MKRGVRRIPNPEWLKALSRAEDKEAVEPVVEFSEIRHWLDGLGVAPFCANRPRNVARAAVVRVEDTQAWADYQAAIADEARAAEQKRIEKEVKAHERKRAVLLRKQREIRERKEYEKKRADLQERQRRTLERRHREIMSHMTIIDVLGFGGWKR